MRQGPPGAALPLFCVLQLVALEPGALSAIQRPRSQGLKFNNRLAFAHAQGAAIGWLMQERRRSIRIRDVLLGQLESFDRSVATCVIRDRNEHGAGVHCDRRIALPEVFILVIESAERLVVRVIWRNENRVGVAFASNVIAFPHNSE